MGFLRIVAIALIFVCASMAWMYLGGKTSSRTRELDSKLSGEVAGLWGCPQSQAPPSAWHKYISENKRTVETKDEDGNVTSTKTYVDKVEVSDGLKLSSSKIEVGLGLDQRKKGLLWYSLYTVDFHGDYRLVNDKPQDGWVEVHFRLPSKRAMYDDLVFRVNGRDVDYQRTPDGALSYRTESRQGDEFEVELGYRSQGMNAWRYLFGSNDVNELRDFTLVMTTDFDAIDFPSGSLSPTSKDKKPSGWELTWKYTNMLSGGSLGMVMPKRINPGPLASSISYFAPVSLLFFFSFIFIISTLKDIRMHPMHYLFLAAAFFSFHLLFSYTVDHMDVYLAFGLSAAVSVFLVVSYMRLVVDPVFGYTYAGISQFVYLVMFSYAFFLEGYTGLAVTVGAIITLFVLMQMTARVDWYEKLGRWEKRGEAGQ